jgi:uncharacterized protein (TIGR00645 family)
MLSLLSRPKREVERIPASMGNTVKLWTARAGHFLFSIRWVLYPINIALVIALSLYVLAFLVNDYRFIRYQFTWDMEPLMVMLLGFVDASMVANLIIMVIQGSYQIFIHKFDLVEKSERPQWIDHIDSGILKVKVALSIAGITLVQILKDFVNIEKVDWTLEKHRIVIHLTALVSALVMALVWRVTHPTGAAPDSVIEHASGA